MWDKETSKRIAGILSLIADPPNLSPHPQNPASQVFDGGEIITQTGLIVFKFLDGTKALYGTGLDVCLTITLPHGERISVSSSYEYCNMCFNHIPPMAKSCDRCGGRQ
jgi:hypothetical protein